MKNRSTFLDHVAHRGGYQLGQPLNATMQTALEPCTCALFMKQTSPLLGSSTALMCLTAGKCEVVCLQCACGQSKADIGLHAYFSPPFLFHP